MEKVILVSGKAGSGKDTFAKELKLQLEENGKSVLITHYADLVKYVAREFFGWNGEKDLVGRSILQEVGTDIFRNYDLDYWVKFIIGIIDVLGHKWDYVIIPDCRFPNEIELWMDYPNLSVRVERDFKSSLDEEQKAHLSETALDKFEFDKTFYFLDMEDMKYQVSEFVERGMS